MAAWPTLPEVRSWLRMQPNSTDDSVISMALAAAVDYGNKRTNYRWDPAAAPGWPTPLPDAAHLACVQHAAKLYKRRDSVDGTLGFGEAGAIRVGRFDADIEALYATACAEAAFPFG